MKTKYLILFLISVLIFNSIGCITYKVEPVKPVEIIKVKYIAIARISKIFGYPEITASWNNDQRETVTVHNLALKRNAPKFSDKPGETSPSPDLDEPFKYWYTEILAIYYIPKNEPLAIAVTVTNEADSLGVSIVVNDILWKSDTCEGVNCTVSASGIYDK
ncbi:hypothetical protein ES703_69814 [subsurface metagenome]